MILSGEAKLKTIMDNDGIQKKKQTTDRLPIPAQLIMRAKLHKPYTLSLCNYGLN